MTTKKDFEFAAENVRIIPKDYSMTKLAVLTKYLDKFRKESPKFDAKRFREACLAPY